MRAQTIFNFIISKMEKNSDFLKTADLYHLYHAAFPNEVKMEQESDRPLYERPLSANTQWPAVLVASARYTRTK
jgi:hypothetical protein